MCEGFGVGLAALGLVLFVPGLVAYVGAELRHRSTRRLLHRHQAWQDQAWSSLLRDIQRAIREARHV